MQPPKIDFRLYPSFRHSGQGWVGLKVTLCSHLIDRLIAAFDPLEDRAICLPT